MNIAVLTSGGVDSAVALAELVRAGYAVTAIYLKIWLEDELSYLGDCPWQEDLSYITAVCEQLNVPLRVLPLQKEYRDQVVTYTIEQAKAGFTPNPDIMCNSRIKFGAALSALLPEFTHIASGHYAQVSKGDNGKPIVHRAPDAIKDQTYFLAQVPHETFSRLLFPIGHLTKAEVRQKAQEYGLANKDRKDSQGICFLGKLKFPDFLRHYLGTKPGNIIEYETGTVLGEHEGYWYYTAGQRQGLRLAGGPWYVVAKDSEKNIVYVSRTYYDSEKKRNTLTITRCNWLTTMIPGEHNLHVKLRHGPILVPATVIVDNDLKTAHITLPENDQGIAAGQFAVLYRNTQCLGSGVIQ